MNTSLNEELLKRLLRITIAYQIIGLLIITIWVVITFNKSSWILIGVPQSVRFLCCFQR